MKSRPPTEGPAMLAIWKTMAPQVTALTKWCLGIRLGRNAEEAGLLKARPIPMAKSTA